VATKKRRIRPLTVMCGGLAVVFVMMVGGLSQVDQVGRRAST
jgi:hypothetical protein